MNTIELAYQPFVQAIAPARSHGGWLWLIVGVALLAALYFLANQTRKEESFTAPDAD